MLLYIWIKQFKNIENQGFNFSSEFLTNYDKEKNEISIRKNKNYIPDFFNNRISDLTCIVGENGSGKSNLLEYVISCHVKSKKRWNKPHIFVTENEGVITLFYHQSEFGSIVVTTDMKNIKVVKFNTSSDIKIHDAAPRNFDEIPNRIIYYSNFFDGHFKDFQAEHDGYTLKDISTTLRIQRQFDNKKSYQENEKELENSNLTYRRLEFKTQLKFLSSLSSHKKFSEIDNYPNTIEISTTPLYTVSYIRNNVKDGQFDEKFFDDLESIEQHIFEGENFRDQLIKKILFCKIYESIVSFGKSEIFGIVKKIKSQLGNGIQINLDEVFLSFQRNLQPIQKIGVFLEKNVSFFKKNSLVVSISQISILYDLLNLIELLNLRFTDPLEFDWKYGDSDSGSLSSGELSLLTLFSRLDGLEWPDYPKPAILILDEPEIGFHPEWQRLFLKNLLGFFDFTSKGIEQIIITSHSPFILSDFTKDHVIFLKKGDNSTCQVVPKEMQIKTFGANIHSLLADSFFLQKGLIGQFAKEKIDNLFQVLNDKKEGTELNLNSAENLISSIGEPLISSKLAELLAKKNGKDTERARLESIKRYIDDQLDKLDNNDSN